MGGNRYAYVDNRPITRADPFGLIAVGLGRGVSGAAAVLAAGVMGEGSCMAVFDGKEFGVLCCAAAGPAFGETLGGGVRFVGAFCPNCHTICDMEGTFGGAGGFGTLGVGVTVAGGVSVSENSATFVGAIGPAGGEGGAAGLLVGQCKLILGGSKCHSCNQKK